MANKRKEKRRDHWSPSPSPARRPKRKPFVQKKYMNTYKKEFKWVGEAVQLQKCSERFMIPVKPFQRLVREMADAQIQATPTLHQSLGDSVI